MGVVINLVPQLIVTTEISIHNFMVVQFIAVVVATTLTSLVSVKTELELGFIALVFNLKKKVKLSK
ncbi:hypothetical protein SAMN05444344_2807 [Tenacibaculum mesophilum]|uniref:Uncharacterized protein n=1 Tax=Tenacibaculum mesophilum TaxID=104268 RepID=A0ABM7CF17_9FLAO|nr:hypothetical protein D6200_07175 [Tenacibaculum mesophilum]SHG12453.1 hypothetical protein SAMN05444344_2807 [Tenacibaculum mesophilum]